MAGAAGSGRARPKLAGGKDQTHVVGPLQRLQVSWLERAGYNYLHSSLAFMRAMKE